MLVVVIVLHSKEQFFSLVKTEKYPFTRIAIRMIKRKSIEAEGEKETKTEKILCIHFPTRYRGHLRPFCMQYTITTITT